MVPLDRKIRKGFVRANGGVRQRKFKKLLPNFHSTTFFGPIMLLLLPNFRSTTIFGHNHATIVTQFPLYRKFRAQSYYFCISQALTLRHNQSYIYLNGSVFTSDAKIS